MSDAILLQAFQGTNKKIPVWFMRQAGRYLPQYRAIKEQHSLNEMFATPELATKVTLLPIEALGVDAAILFADILSLPSQMGFTITFEKEGPVIKNPINRASDLSKIHNFDDLDYVAKTIQLINHDLPEHIPLIGFAGSPFTVLTYLVEGGSAKQFTKTFDFAKTDSKAFHKLMSLLTENTINYLKLQQKAGIKVFQLFDTWGGILSEKEYEQWVLPYVRTIFQSVHLPSIYYLRNGSHLLSLMDETGAAFLSVCEKVEIGSPELRKTVHLGIQGNLHNELLYEDEERLQLAVTDLLTRAHNHEKYIFNLSHGVFPDVDAGKLRSIVQLVHNSLRKPQVAPFVK